MTTLAIHLNDSLAAHLSRIAADQQITLEELARRSLCSYTSAYNKETLAAIDDVEHHQNLVGPFHSVEDLMRDLDDVEQVFDGFLRLNKTFLQNCSNKENLKEAKLSYLELDKLKVQLKQ